MSAVPLFTWVKFFDNYSEDIHNYIQKCCERILRKCHAKSAVSHLTTIIRTDSDSEPFKQIEVNLKHVNIYKESNNFDWKILDEVIYDWDIGIYRNNNKYNLIFNIGMESREHIKHFKNKYLVECNKMLDDKLFDISDIGSGHSRYAIDTGE